MAPCHSLRGSVPGAGGALWVARDRQLRLEWSGGVRLVGVSDVRRGAGGRGAGSLWHSLKNSSTTVKALRNSRRTRERASKQHSDENRTRPHRTGVPARIFFSWTPGRPSGRVPVAPSPDPLRDRRPWNSLAFGECTGFAGGETDSLHHSELEGNRCQGWIQQCSGIQSSIPCSARSRSVGSAPL